MGLAARPRIPFSSPPKNSEEVKLPVDKNDQFWPLGTDPKCHHPKLEPPNSLVVVLHGTHYKITKPLTPHETVL